MMKTTISLFFSLFMMIGASNAQLAMLLNNNKTYGYTESLTVKRAGSRELQKRFIHWANEYYKDKKYTITIDDTNNRYVTIVATHTLPYAKFQVNRSHKDRVLTYTLKFDAVKKDYTYTISDIQYSCIEIDRKGAETPMSGPYEEFKSPTKMSVDSDLDEIIRGVIKSFKEASEIVLPEPKEEPKAEENPTDTTNENNSE